jgi:hypothetical protein
MGTPDPAIINFLALERARQLAADLRRPKGSREEALRIVRQLERSA